MVYHNTTIHKKQILKERYHNMSLKIDTPQVTLRELALNKVKEAIFTGYFPSGTRLVERRLCEELGVSRSVVREVIRYLEADGLIEILPNKGPIVAELNWNIASQVYEIRLLLEKSAIEDCIKNLTPEITSDLKKHLLQLKEAYKTDNINLLIDISRELYQTIFMAAKHEVAWEVILRLNGRINRLRALTMTSTKREMSGYDRMKSICEAIYIEKDAKIAKEAVTGHILEVKRVAKNILENHQL